MIAQLQMDRFSGVNEHPASLIMATSLSPVELAKYERCDAVELLYVRPSLR